MIKFCEWESKVLGISVGEIVGKDERWSLEAHRFDYLYVKLPASELSNIQMYEEDGFRISDVSTNFIMRIDAPQIVPKNVREYVPTDYDTIMSIARDSFTIDRFHRDAYLTAKQADNLYESWVSNACNKIYGDAVFVLEDEDKNIVGFSSCRRGTVGHIDLTAVSIDGIFKHVPSKAYPMASHRLLSADINFLHKCGSRFVSTSTQIDNHSSVRSLVSFGFRMTHSTITLSKGKRIWRLSPNTSTIAY